MSNRIIIVGAFLETIELCEECGLEIVGLIDSVEAKMLYGYPVLGKDDDANEIHSAYGDCFIVLSPDSSRIRRKLFKLYTEAGFDFCSVISPLAHISKSSIIGRGAIIQAGVNISSNTNIGEFVKLNYNVNVMHDVQVGDFSVVAPNAVLLGRSKIGKDVYVGANSTVLTNSLVADLSNVKPCSII